MELLLSESLFKALLLPVNAHNMLFFGLPLVMGVEGERSKVIKLVPFPRMLPPYQH